MYGGGALVTQASQVTSELPPPALTPVDLTPTPSHDERLGIEHGAVRPDRAP